MLRSIGQKKKENKIILERKNISKAIKDIKRCELVKPRSFIK